MGERLSRPVAACRLIAAGSAASKSRPSCERLIPVSLLYTMGSVTTAAGSARRTTRCRAPVPIRVPEYRLRHGHPQTDGCWRDPSSRQWDACGPTRGRFRHGRPGRHHPGAARPAPGGGRQPRLRRQLHPAQVLLAAAGLSPTRALPPPWRPSTPRRWAHLRLAWRSRSASVVASAAAASASARSASARRWACSARLARALAAATCPAASLVTDSICASAASVSPTMVSLPGMCTIHANSAREAVTKMCTLPLLAGENVGHRIFDLGHTCRRSGPAWPATAAGRARDARPSRRRPAARGWLAGPRATTTPGVPRPRRRPGVSGRTAHPPGSGDGAQRSALGRGS